LADHHPGWPTAAADNGQRYDATGKVPCAQYRGQPMGQCDFGVMRKGNGGAAFRVQRESDLNMIRVGDERDEISDAVVSGG
jgi:hypothetical protein